MKIKENQIFNLMDTNGRRSDVINALQIYLSILNNIEAKWGFLPESLAQYEFYKQAIEQSPDVLSEHRPYDLLLTELDNNSDFKEALLNKDILWIKNNENKYTDLINKFDKGIEDRARHYTGNLVKLGFTDKDRNITPTGYILLNKTKLIKDDIEKMLPVDSINLVYLRQLLKLRVYDNNKTKFYSPFIFAIYLLLKNDRMSENIFFELVQGLNPYFDFTKLDNFIDNYKENDILYNIKVIIPQEISINSLILQTIFKKYFKNKKSSETIEIYYTFYNLLFDFSVSKNETDLNKLLQYYENNKAKLNKAFGYGKNIFLNKKGNHCSPCEFIQENKEIFETNLNKNIYIKFYLSKYLDQLKEYSDTTKRIFNASGIISFNNGYIELAYKELCKCIFFEDNVKSIINGYSNDYETYETGIDSYFGSIKSLSEILLYTSENLQEIRSKIKKEFGIYDLEKITDKLSENRKKEFNEFIDKKYPVEKVKELLVLFNNRRNDIVIQNYAGTSAAIPTIYEFITGIAWYYFSGKRIDLLNSYNLTLSADFEPLVHAGGGKGDIVIYEKDKVIMLEATLMNANSQKRGEWEPVLRHSVNLKVEEEINKTNRQVTTFFIADEFDLNTVNIWKAVASVPMQSSINKENYTDNVVIMPVSSNELCSLTDKSDQYDEIINEVHKLFEVEKNNFNINWRKEFVSKII